MSQPLSGTRVLDLTRILSGPFCTMKLGDMGADVIKIEQPGIGDDTRTWGPPFIDGESAYFLSVNRNKKSVTLNLKSKEGKQILRRLIAHCDVLCENFRAGVMENLGFGYAQVRRLSPKMIYCSISGYGHTSKLSHRPSYDLIIQGESGLMDMTGFPDGPPSKVGISIADVTAGLLAVEGILLALLHREKIGKGQKVDISLLDGLISLFTYQSQIALSSDQEVTRRGNEHPTITPYETFQTKDGYINVAVGSESLWKNFCNAIERKDLESDPKSATNSDRVKNRNLLKEILSKIFLQRPTKEWISLLSKHDVPVGEIPSVVEALKNQALKEREMVTEIFHRKLGKIKTVGIPVKLSSSKGKIRFPPPLLSEHTYQVLTWLGYSKNEIEQFKKKKII